MFGTLVKGVAEFILRGGKLRRKHCSTVIYIALPIDVIPVNPFNKTKEYLWKE